MKGFWGDLAMTVASLYIIVFIVIFCFPFTLPVTPQGMNYTSLIFGGFTLFMGAWWFLDAKKSYPGPVVMRQGVQIRGETHSFESEQKA